MTGDATDVWSADSGALLAELRNPDASGYPTLAFSDDARWLAMNGGGDAQVVDTADWKPARAVGPRVRSLSFAARGALLAVGPAGGDAAVWTVGRDWGARQRLRTARDGIQRCPRPGGESATRRR